MALTRKQTSLSAGKSVAVGKKSVKDVQSKRKAEASPDGSKKKRSAFGDLTNATANQQPQMFPKLMQGLNKIVISNSKPLKDTKTKRKTRKSDIENSDSSSESLPSSQENNENFISADENTPVDKTLYTTAIEEPILEITVKSSTVTESTVQSPPEGVHDFDKETWTDPFQMSRYCMEIFEYYKSREPHFAITKYLEHQPEVNKQMRAVLVDWLVEVQESFELNHETLYLGVKLIDFFLSRSQSIPRANLQLLASTAMLIAAKFDERCPPAIEDFVYICDDAYDSNQIIRTEITILKSIDFDLGIPISYTFLRRYARCAKLTMEVLTLSRYILEMSLMDYNLIEELDSRLAAAALSLAMQMSKLEPWNKTLEYYSEFKLEDLNDLLPKLNDVLKKAGKNGLRTMYTKYCHKIFFEVAKIPPLEDSALICK